MSGASAGMIAASGLAVTFVSGGVDLRGRPPVGSNGDIFVRHLLVGNTTLLSGQQGSNAYSGGNDDPVISADGTAVAWEGNAGAPQASVLRR